MRHYFPTYNFIQWLDPASPRMFAPHKAMPIGATFASIKLHLFIFLYQPMIIKYYCGKFHKYAKLMTALTAAHRIATMR